MVGGHFWEDRAGCLRADMGDNQLAVAIENHPMDGRCRVAENGKVQTLASRMGTGGMNVPLVMNERQYAQKPKVYGICDANGTLYTVRRLTPTECARLQGFPDWWCADLETENPTDEEIEFWADVFETHRKIVGTSEKPKSRKQIIKWLQNTHSDSAEYKMWGNGVALPCVSFVMSGIKKLLEET